MPDKFQHKYRIPSARLQGWDYGWNAAYFVTIVTKDRECFFGQIVETQNIASPGTNKTQSVETHNYASLDTGKMQNVETQNIASLRCEMQLSPIGIIANDYWLEIPKHFPFVELGEFVVMPNHVHGIIIINKPDDRSSAETQNIASPGTNKTQSAETHNHASPNKIKTQNKETQNFASLPLQSPTANTFGPQSQNLASIIRGYKSAVKKYATLNDINFAWQSRFHDHIIRDEQSFQNISNYIINNPANWANDQLFK